MFSLSNLRPDRLKDKKLSQDDRLMLIGRAHLQLCKQAGEPELSYSLAGRLFLAKTGWLLLDVPNAIVRGLFDALHEPGVELPFNGKGDLHAHISVMSADEVKKIGADKLTERGHMAHFSLGPVKTVRPSAWDDISRVWYVTVNSPELAAIRRSYGLDSRPHDGEYDFHITFAVLRRNTLRTNALSKAEALDQRKRAAEEKAILDVCLTNGATHPGDLSNALLEFAMAEGQQKSAAVKEDDEKIPAIAVDLDGTICEPGPWKGQDHFYEVREGAKEALEHFVKEGYRVIIYTCRGDHDKVKAFLREHKLPFHELNKNPDQPPGSNIKVYADIYIDDRALHAKKPWKEIVEEVDKRLKEEKQAVARWRTPGGLKAILGDIVSPLTTAGQNWGSRTLSRPQQLIEGRRALGLAPVTPKLSELASELNYHKNYEPAALNRVSAGKEPNKLYRGIQEANPWTTRFVSHEGQPTVYTTPSIDAAKTYAADAGPLGKLLSTHEVAPNQLYGRGGEISTGKLQPFSERMSYAQNQWPKDTGRNRSWNNLADWEKTQAVDYSAHESPATATVNPHAGYLLAGERGVAKVPNSGKWQNILKTLFPPNQEFQSWSKKQLPPVQAVEAPAPGLMDRLKGVFSPVLKQADSGALGGRSDSCQGLPEAAPKDLLDQNLLEQCDQPYDDGEYQMSNNSDSNYWLSNQPGAGNIPVPF
jgi:hypothetical protein